MLFATGVVDAVSTVQAVVEMALVLINANADVSALETITVGASANPAENVTV